MARKLKGPRPANIDDYFTMAWDVMRDMESRSVGISTEVRLKTKVDMFCMMAIAAAIRDSKK